MLLSHTYLPWFAPTHSRYLIFMYELQSVPPKVHADIHFTLPKSPCVPINRNQNPRPEFMRLVT